MVLPSCFLTIPALSTTVIDSGGYHVPATLAYAPTNTNYFGATACGLNSLTSTSYPATTAKCTLPASVSGKAYSVTPVVYVPRATPGVIDLFQRPMRVDNYTCDPIPVASMNNGNFQFSCKNLRGKDMGQGHHSISWILPAAAGVAINTYGFIAYQPISTPTYVVNSAKATTNLVPTTNGVTTYTRSFTDTKTVRVTVTTGTTTTTCTYTVRATATPVSGRHLARADGSNLQLGSRIPVRHAGGADVQPAKLKERAASVTPAIGKPDFVYPPYGKTTIYVKSISTSLYTITTYSTSYWASPIITTTIRVNATEIKTVTVTVTPTPTLTP
ncbi:hypothetical protein F5144DRAFT_534085 [Chaetomium tenue]|uniref:Uncharacterized protein n=1 Tax=Chaetomium tenue TaxID=1854479 RepID=A0ACB7PCG2_9PEZI|nr:hypothetical protein F5144DRAFT_534085 [Chaetomium globosum]